MRTCLRAAFITGALLIAASAAAASPGSFVYAVATTCSSQPCSINLLVYDASTGGLVTTILLATGRAPGSSGLAISPDGSRLYVSVSVGASPAVVVLT